MTDRPSSETPGEETDGESARDGKRKAGARPLTPGEDEASDVAIQAAGCCLFESLFGAASCIALIAVPILLLR